MPLVFHTAMIHTLTSIWGVVCRYIVLKGSAYLSGADGMKPKNLYVCGNW